MSLFNETNVGRFNRLIQRLHNIKGVTPSPQVSPEIECGLNIENDRPEWLVLGGTIPFCDFRNLAGTAGQTSHVGIRNPTGSGALATVWTIVNNTGVAGSYRLGIRAQGAIDTSSQIRASDSRVFATFAPGLLLWSFTGANQTNLTARISLLQNTALVLPMPFILSPGFDLFWGSDALNQQIEAMFWGYVRPIEPTETNP